MKQKEMKAYKMYISRYTHIKLNGISLSHDLLYLAVVNPYFYYR